MRRVVSRVFRRSFVNTVPFSSQSFKRVFDPTQEMRPYFEQEIVDEQLKIHSLLPSFFDTVNHQLQLAFKKFKNPFTEERHPHPTIFISHAYPDERHHPEESWTPDFLLKLVYHLSKIGFDARIDMLHSTVGRPMVDFMLGHIKKSDIVLPIGTRSFVLKVTHPDYARSMVRFELSQIRNRMDAYGHYRRDAAGIMPLQLTGGAISDVFVPPYEKHYVSGSFQGSKSYLQVLLEIALSTMHYFESGNSNPPTITQISNDPRFWYNQLVRELGGHQEMQMLLRPLPKDSVQQMWDRRESDRQAFEERQKHQINEMLKTWNISREQLAQNIRNNANCVKSDVVTERLRICVLSAMDDAPYAEAICKKFFELHPGAVELTMARPGTEDAFRDALLDSHYVVKLISGSFFKDRLCLENLMHLAGQGHISNMNASRLVSINTSCTDVRKMILNAYAWWDKERTEVKKTIQRREGEKQSIPDTYHRQYDAIDRITEMLGDPRIFSLMNRFILPYEQVLNTHDLLQVLQLNFNDIYHNRTRIRWVQEAVIRNTIPKNTLTPEFPPEAPQFPATPTRTITLPHRSNLGIRTFIMKDESVNLTGTHKDRMALEVVQYYRRYIERERGSNHGLSLDQLISEYGKENLPVCSLITSGSAGVAIQVKFKTYHLPDLRVIIDQRLKDTPVHHQLEQVGCVVFFVDLAQEELSSERILKITQNEKGWDLTNREVVDPEGNIYYDWLSFEILNNDATHFFVPFGTGDLFYNILSICCTIEYMNHQRIEHDPRLTRKNIPLKNIRLFGATTNNPSSKLDKLYAPYTPRLEGIQRTLAEAKAVRAVHGESRILEVDEDYVNAAITMAAALNLNAENSGLAGFALYLQMERALPRDAKVCIVNTGKLKIPPMSIFNKASISPQLPPSSPLITLGQS